MSDLNFDNDVEVDIKQAKEYLRKISSDIHSLGLEDCEDGNYVHDSCHSKLHLVDYKKVTMKLMQQPSQISATVDMYKLACKVKANAELFAQIEYMTRKVSVDETMNCHMNLIVQNLLHWSTEIGQFNQFEFGQITMNDKTPLSSLGCLAPLLCIHTSCVIESTKETALVCHLLTQLCHEVGIKNVYLLLVEDLANIKHLRISHIDLNDNKSLARGGAGIVTGHADVDSAVDAFLTASSIFPWNLRRLLVQENVYESFKKAVSWKVNLKHSSNNDSQLIIDHYQNKCTDLFIYDDKVFVLNYVGSLEELEGMTKHAVVVEAFRTTKELLSLVKQYKPNSLSLWSCDIAEANEIAFGVDAPIVWINDINNFNGPPKTSQGFYSNVVQNHATLKTVDKTKDFENLIKLRNNWLKLNLNVRRDKILKAIEDCDFQENKVAMEFARELQRGVCGDSNKFVEIEGFRMCIGIKETVGVVFAMANSLQKLSDVIKSSVFGNGVVVPVNRIDDFGIGQELIESLKKEGVPITISENMPAGDFLEIKSPYLLFKTRIIWTNYGTTFAN